MSGAADELAGSETVLVVDDDDDARRGICRTLDFHGYTVLEAGSGERALERARDHEGDIDLLLADLVMPGLSGQALGEKISGLRPDIRILYVSGYADRGPTEDELESGRVAFAAKPLTIQELAGKVREILDRTPPRRNAGSE